ncbi:phosphatase 2C-like domain-containing protein [Epithele typhae]|uniref:phosphatase 2C-like domain-containing protein n=1 Tax=Epithele typhae TaxID=378194 RepID=UPI002008C5EC|nr:phosphatase 2C-like domain-containing protein [Epithele typhae]KAH9939727.1 phosphatase 2C-like domain-containing protein [Epithele typhae]
MKPIQKRLYTVLPRPPSIVTPSVASTSQLPLPRVRSNSASSPRSLYTASHLSFFDASSPPPPPPTSRGNSVVIGTRIAAEVRPEVEGNHPSSHQQAGPLPYPLALSLGQSESSPHLPLSPYNPFLPYQVLSPLFVISAKSNDTPAPDPRKKRQRARYHLDVGAYGIPKRSRGHCVAGRDGHGRFDVRPDPGLTPEELARAVQVGEDAYFVRDNAMGVADGVGGWSRHRRAANSAEPTPSALFARRLMHYCSEEVDAAASERSGASLAPPESHAEADDLCAELQDSLEELEEGLDVLMILEKAYEKALRSHVHRAGTSSSSSRSPSPSDSLSKRAVSSSASASLSPHSPSPSSAPSRSAPGAIPLFEGSSTALVAILEHPSARPAKALGDAALFNPQPASGKPSQPEVSTDGAVIRIAHLGDCMGMLIRGEEIAWRTEEMWWNFNTPVQLGPASSTRPHDARIFTVPVEEDDILILASDGLSDNLWDAEILDEVARFRRSFMTPAQEEQPFSTDGKNAPVSAAAPAPAATATFRRSTLAGMLSEALCSRAKRVSETRGSRREKKTVAAPATSATETDVPFAKRAREQGKLFEGGKPDDISVLVAVISPVE